MNSSTTVDRVTAPKKKGSQHNPQHDGSPIHGFLPSFSPKPAINAVGVKPPYVDHRPLGLLGPYHRHAIGMFNTCSRGLTHRSLTNTGRGYNLEGAGFPHTTHQPSQPMVFTFHLRAPPGLQFNHKPSIKPKFKFKEPMAASWSSNHSVIYHGLHLCLAIANDLSLAIGSTRIDWKLISIQLGYQSNSYNLMHNQES
jgi:hypothetical protein